MEEVLLFEGRTEERGEEVHEDAEDVDAERGKLIYVER